MIHMKNSFPANSAAYRKSFGFKFIFLLAFTLLMNTTLLVKGQDPEFSQSYANPLYLNPAFTGTNAIPRIAMSYRNQWPRQGNTFSTYSLAFDKFINSTTGGIGFRTMYDVQLNGVINSLSSSFIYAEHFNISDGVFFTMALESGFIYKKFNTSGLIFPGMIDQGTGAPTGSYPFPTESGQKLIPDFSFGTVGQFDDYYFGIAIHHLTQPDQSIFLGDQTGKLPRKITVHAGAKSHEFHRGLLSREYTLSPNLIYIQQGGFRQLNLGIYMNEAWLTYGIWYRNNLTYRPNSMSAMIGYQSGKMQFGYSFDFSFASSAAYGNGAHEISLIFFLGSYHRRLYDNTMVIPQM